MRRINRALIVVFIFFLIIVVFEVVYLYSGIPKNPGSPVGNLKADVCKPAPTVQPDPFCVYAKKYEPIAYSVIADRESIKGGALVGLMSDYTYKYRVKKIIAPCWKKVNNKDFAADLCIEVYYEGAKTEPPPTGTLIYKFLGTKNLTVSVRKDGKDNPFKMEDIKDGDTLLIRSTHDETKGSVDSAYNLDNVLNVSLIKL